MGWETGKVNKYPIFKKRGKKGSKNSGRDSGGPGPFPASLPYPALLSLLSLHGPSSELLERRNTSALATIVTRRGDF